MTCIALTLSLHTTALQRTVSCPPSSRQTSLCLSLSIYSNTVYRLIMFTHSAHSSFSLFTFLLIHIAKIKHFSDSFSIAERENKSTHVSVGITQIYSQPLLLFYTIRNVIETISSI